MFSNEGAPTAPNGDVPRDFTSFVHQLLGWCASFTIGANSNLQKRITPSHFQQRYDNVHSSITYKELIDCHGSVYGYLATIQLSHGLLLYSSRSMLTQQLRKLLDPARRTRGCIPTKPVAASHC
jgi:hypothetical protein